MNIDIEPKFKLGEKVNIVSLRIPLRVEVIRRTVEVDIDHVNKKSFYYDLKHKEVLNGWSWDRIPEDSLLEWIHEAKYFVSNMKRKST